MPEKISNIAKNTSYFTFALILQKVASFAYFTIIARALGPDDLGKYYFAISFTTIFAIFIDIGLANVLTREIAKDQNEAQKFLGSILAIKIPLAAITYVSTLIIINLMGYPEITRILVYFSTISMILDSFTLTFFSVSRGFHNLSFESLSSVVFQIIVLIFGLAILKLNLGLRWLMGSMVIASLFNFFYSAHIVRNKWELKIRPLFDLRIIKTIVKIALPFALFGIFQRFFTYFDSVLLSVLAGDKYVGYYQVAFKIINALQFLPLAFTASLYPAFALYWSNNKDQLQVTFERAMNYLIIISLPISAGIFILADKIVLLFKADYLDAVLPLRLVMIALFFVFLNFPVGSILNACDRQRINTANMGVALAASVILNLVLIKYFQNRFGNGAIGASITVIAANFLMFILGIFQVPKIIKLRAEKILPAFFKAAAAAAIMASIIFLLKPVLNVFLIIGISGLAYFLALFLMGGFSREDITSICQSFGGKTAVNER